MKPTLHVVFCAHCGAEIEACDGAFGDWMHTRTRRERCARTMDLAEPEHPERAARPSNHPHRARVGAR